MTDQTPDTATEPDARRGAVRARRRLARTGTIMAVMALGAGGGVAAAAGAGGLLAPAGSLTSATHSVSAKDLTLDPINSLGQLGQLQGMVPGGAQAVPMRDSASPLPTGDLTGSVTDLGGKPLSGIDLYEVTSKAIKLLGRTGDGGTFKVDCPTGPVLLSGNALDNSDGGEGTNNLGKLAYQFLGGGSLLKAAPVPLCGDAHAYRSQLAPGGQITGVLKNAAGSALPGTPVTLANADDAKGLQLKTVTDKKGRYLFSGLPAGRYQTLAGSSPLGPISNLTAGLPLVRDLVAGVTKAATPDDSQGGSGTQIGSIGRLGGPTSLLQGLSKGVVPGMGDNGGSSGLIVGTPNDGSAVDGLPMGGNMMGGMLPH
jgi:Carboxypeptidase regulatory-like domain